jgi:hypothetical protein
MKTIILSLLALVVLALKHSLPFITSLFFSQI